VVRSKVDLGREGAEGPALSVISGDGLTELLDLLGERARASLHFGESTIALNLRQEAALRAGMAALNRARQASEIEFLAEDLRQAAAALQSLIGGIGVEEVLGHIFGRFCIGK
jgi:tRNA modification GTPase